MSHTRSVLLACVLAALPVPAVALESDRPSAERYNVRLEYLWWSPQPTGELQKGFSETTGTLIDAQTDLGLQAYHSPNQLRGVLRLGNSWKLRGSWSRIDWQRSMHSPQI